MLVMFLDSVTDPVDNRAVECLYCIVLLVEEIGKLPGSEAEEELSV